MGFLFDSLSNMVGDIQNGLISFDNQVSERSCDNYTHASGSCSTNKKSNDAKHTTAAPTGSIGAAKKSVDTNRCIAELDKTIGELDELLKNANADIAAEEVENFKHRQQITGNAGKKVFDLSFSLISDVCSAESANILANVIAVTIINGDSVKDITLDNIMAYCDNAKIPEPATVMAMREFKKLNIDQIVAAIDNANIYSSAEETAIQKPFMDFSKYTSPVAMVE